MMARRCARDQFSIRKYKSSTECRKPWECTFLSRSLSFRKRELIIGVSVKATNKETRMAIAMVHPKEVTYLRAYPGMNAIGRKIINSERVVASTGSAIFLVDSIEARMRTVPFAS